MIATIVQYLHGARVPFRLFSYPSEESLPIAAHHIPEHGIMVNTRVVLLDGRPTLACFPVTEQLDLPALGNALGGMAIEGETRELPQEFSHAEGPIPPLGQLFGLPLVIHEQITQYGVLVFRAFGESDYFEIPYEDFARLEAPRVASFASLGELPAAPPVH